MTPESSISLPSIARAITGIVSSTLLYRRCRRALPEITAAHQGQTSGVSPSRLSPELAFRMLYHGDQQQNQIVAVKAFECSRLFAAADGLCRRGLV